MGSFRFVLSTDLPPAAAFARVLDLRVHDDVVPLTRITEGRVAADALHAGSRFVARTALGPLGIDDPMVVDELTPPTDDAPGHALIRTQGRVLRGVVRLQVDAAPGGGSSITWDQDLRVPWLSAIASPVVTAVGRAAYRRTLQRILAAPSR